MIVGRAVGELSDGTVVAMVQDGANFYLYTSSDKVTWTLRNTLTPVGSSINCWSIGVASNNDIYFVYNRDTEILCAYKFTYATGPTWTVGAREVIFGSTTGIGGASGGMGAVFAVDVSFLAGSVPFVGCMYTDSPAAGNPQYYAYRYIIKRTSDNTWVTVLDGYGGDSHQLYSGSHYWNTTVCGENITAIPGNNLVYVGVTRKDPNTATAVNDVCAVMQVNVNTGANQSGTFYSEAPAGSVSASTPRDMIVYSPTAAIFDWIYAYGTSTLTFKIKRTTATASVVNWKTSSAFTQQSRSATSPQGQVGFMYTAASTTSPPAYETSRVAVNLAHIGVLYLAPGTTYLRSMFVAAQIWGVSSTGTNGSEIFNSRTGYWRPQNTNVVPWDDDGAAYHYNKVGKTYPQSPASRYVHGLSYNSRTKNFMYQENIQPNLSPYAPASGATVTTDKPTYKGSEYIGFNQVQQQSVIAEIQVASDNAFTTSVKDMAPVQLNSKYVKPSSNQTVYSTYTPTDAEALTEGTWYMRTRAIDLFGKTASAWSAYTSFIDSHPPAALPISPTDDQTVDYGASGTIPLSWRFSSTAVNDTQSAYQVIVERNDTGALILDTGKVTSSSTTVNVTIPSIDKDIQLRWKVQVWNQNNIQSTAYSAYALFHVSDKPTTSITAPTAAQVVGYPQPTIQWTFAASNNRTQMAYEVVVTRTSDNTIVYDSGTINSSSLSHQLTQQLADNTNYSVQVIVTDNVGLSQTSAAVAFSTSWVPVTAPAFTVDQSTYDTSGYVKVTWNNSSQDASYVSYRVYRRPTGSTASPSLLAEITGGGPNYEFDDWTAGANQPYDYAVVQVATRSGSNVESAYNWTSVTPYGTDYWLIGTDTATNSSAFKMRIQVSADSFSEEYESAILQIIGRGRKVDYGTRWGYTGSLTSQLRTDSTSTARAKRLQLESLKAQKTAVYLRTPFGDVWQVNVDNISLARVAGVGQNEFVDATIPYSEVS